MKTKEFINKIEGLGFKVEDDNPYLIFVYDQELGQVLNISKTEEHTIQTNFVSGFANYHKLPVQRREELFSIATEYALTPVKNRGEENEITMKADEFIAKVNEMGFDVWRHNPDIWEVINKSGRTLLTIPKKHVYSIDTEHNLYEQLPAYKKRQLLEISIKFASTPIEEREEHKYYLRLPNALNEKYNFLNYHTKTQTYLFSQEHESALYQTTFTKKEIEQLPHKDLINTLIKEEVVEK